MYESKKQKVKSKGWRTIVKTADKEFLGLIINQKNDKMILHRFYISLIKPQVKVFSNAE